MTTIGNPYTNDHRYNSKQHAEYIKQFESYQILVSALIRLRFVVGFYKTLSNVHENIPLGNTTIVSGDIIVGCR